MKCLRTSLNMKKISALQNHDIVMAAHFVLNSYTTWVNSYFCASVSAAIAIEVKISLISIPKTNI